MRLARSLEMHSIIGTSPIHPLAFLTGKLALFACAAFALLRLLGVDASAASVPGVQRAGAILLLASVLLATVAMLQLGPSARIGLPTEATTLRTSGLYRLSRNPAYVSLFLFCIGSTLYVPNPFNVLSAGLAIAIHHRITLVEEVFLERRFGDAWREYRARVRRYL